MKWVGKIFGIWIRDIFFFFGIEEGVKVNIKGVENVFSEIKVENF